MTRKCQNNCTTYDLMHESNPGILTVPDTFQTRPHAATSPEHHTLLPVNFSVRT